VAASWAEARAKVNLGLAVTGRRADGFHTLDSVFLRLALHDHLEATFARDPAGLDELVVTGDTGVPAAHDLVLRAAARLREAVGRSLPALRFRLEKDVPVAAGLAGGSADAAAALELAARMWELDLHDEHIATVAVSLGADVPFCRSRTAAARVTGIGEIIQLLPAPVPPMGVVLVTPPWAQSTADVFAAFDRLASVARDGSPEAEAGVVRAPAEGAVGRLASALMAGATAAEMSGLASDLRDANDLWPAATSLLPALVPLRAAVEGALDRPILMTGSGATLLALYPSPQEAARAAAALSRSRPREAEGARIIATASTLPGGVS
jgi:4-diphosphocytidyl-2-C-methyl-D-erythritol kinase